MQAVLEFFLQPPLVVVDKVFYYGGWSILVFLLLKAGFLLMYLFKAKKVKASRKWTLLAVDVPALNVQTPKAVEQLFAHIFSVMDPPTIGTKYWDGFVQYKFSFEIISIEGYIQFLIRTVDKFRDVVEAAVYAQYPEAEITEVEDYVTDIPTQYPNDTHNIWAADFTLVEHYAYPIRSYTEFEHAISKDTVLKDPMGTFLESFSRIGPGEQMWYQMILEPVPDKKWKTKVIEKIKKEIGEKTKSTGIFDKLTDNLLAKEISAGFTELNSQLSGGGGVDGASAASSKDDGPPNNILYLTPGQKKLVEEMERKISKIGFKTKIRSIYVARKEVYNPSRGVNSLVGAINQFNVPSSNSILPKLITSTQYFFAKQRKEWLRVRMMAAYKKRSMYRGLKPVVFNIEELATLWHFPMSHVKTPLLQKAEGKRAEPPPGLPIEAVYEPYSVGGAPGVTSQEEQQPSTFSTDAGDVAYDGNARFG